MAKRSGIRTNPAVIQHVKRLWWQGYSIEKIAKLPEVPVTSRAITAWIKDFGWREELQQVEADVTQDLKAELREFYLDTRNSNRIRLDKMGGIIDSLLDEGVEGNGDKIKNAKLLMETICDYLKAQKTFSADKEVKDEVNNQILNIEQLLVQVGEHQASESYQQPQHADAVRPALPLKSESLGD